MSGFFYIVGAGNQAGHRDFATGIGGMRTGYQGGASAIAVDTELPAGQILAILRSLGQTQVTSVQGVVEADRSCTSCGDGNRLGICAGTIVLGSNAACGIAKFLNVVSTGSQSGHRNLTAGIGGMRTGYQGRTGTVTVDAELPSGQVLAVFRFLG